MKKRFIAIMASCLVLGILFTGCGKGKNDVKDEVTKVESEAGKLLDEGKSAIEGFVSKIQADVKNIEEAVKMEGKATLEIVKEGEETLKYKFTVAEEAVGTEISEFEEKAAGLEEKAKEHLEAMKEEGISDAKAVVQFVDKEGKELYSKVFN